MDWAFFKAMLCVALLCQPSLAEDSEPATISAEEDRGSDSVSDLPVGQLLKLADLLDASGSYAEATRIRGAARERAIRQKLIEQRAIELEALQQEVSRLRALSGEVQTVRFRLLAISIDRTRLGDLADEFNRLIPRPFPQTPAEIETDAGVAKNIPVQEYDLRKIQTDSPLFAALKRRGVLQYLADPTLTATSHCPVTFRSGGEVDVPDLREDGTLFTRKQVVGLEGEVLPKVQAGGLIALHVKLQHGTAGAIVAASDGMSSPIVDSTRIETDVTLHSGETLFLGGARTVRESDWLPSPIVRTISEVVELFNAVDEGAGRRRFGPNAIPKMTRESEVFFLISADLVDLPAEHR